MPLYKEHNVFGLSLEFLTTHSSSLPPTQLFSGCALLSLIIDTEDFATYKTTYVVNSSWDALAAVADEDWLEDLCDDDDIRRRIRPLCDLIRESKRKRK